MRRNRRQELEDLVMKQCQIIEVQKRTITHLEGQIETLETLIRQIRCLSLVVEDESAESISSGAVTAETVQ